MPRRARRISANDEDVAESREAAVAESPHVQTQSSSSTNPCGAKRREQPGPLSGVPLEYNHLRAMGISGVRRLSGEVAYPADRSLPMITVNSARHPCSPRSRPRCTRSGWPSTATGRARRLIAPASVSRPSSIAGHGSGELAWRGSSNGFRAPSGAGSESGDSGSSNSS